MKNPTTFSLCLLLGFAVLAPRAWAAEIACNSVEGEFSHCSLPGAEKLKVKLKRHIDGVCKFQQSWGVDQEGVWVDMGCRAVFQYAAPVARQAAWKRFLPSWPR